MMGVVLGILVTGALAFMVLLVVDYFSEDKRAVRGDKKANNIVLASRTRQLALAKAALVKIAADDSGNPRLDAQIALGEITTEDLKELES